jgi:hypothetical protein
MIKEFKMGEFYFKKESNGNFSIQFTKDCFRGVFRQKDIEKLKSWLEEATRPRYKLVKGNTYSEDSDESVDNYDLVDNETGYIIITFYDEKGFDAKKEAEKLCKRLNRGE